MQKFGLFTCVGFVNLISYNVFMALMEHCILDE